MMPADAPETIRRTLDSLLEGFQIIGFDWTYIYVNPAAARHGRRTPRELVGQRMWDVYPGIEQTPLFAVLQRCMTDRTNAVFENLFEYPDGRNRWFELRVQPVQEGICISSADIHERKEAQLAMKRRLEGLESQPVFARLWRSVLGQRAAH
jgi:PAS domain S-box-containing protein